MVDEPMHFNPMTLWIFHCSLVGYIFRTIWPYRQIFIIKWAYLPSPMTLRSYFTCRYRRGKLKRVRFACVSACSNWQYELAYRTRADRVLFASFLLRFQLNVVLFWTPLFQEVLLSDRRSDGERSDPYYLWVISHGSRSFRRMPFRRIIFRRNDLTFFSSKSFYLAKFSFWDNSSKAWDTSSNIFSTKCLKYLFDEMAFDEVTCSLSQWQLTICIKFNIK